MDECAAHCRIWFAHSGCSQGSFVTNRHTSIPQRCWTSIGRMTGFPLIDVAPLLDDGAPAGAQLAVGRAIDAACRDSGFFLVTGHGIDRGLRDDLESLCRRFFALPEETKAAISMRKGGLAWRGWFPVGDELTSGEPDRK